MYSPVLFISSSDNFKASSLEFPPGEDTSMSCNAFLLPVLPEAIKSAYVDSTSVIANKYPHSSTWIKGKKETELLPPEKHTTLWNRNRKLKGSHCAVDWLSSKQQKMPQHQNLEKLEKKQSRKQKMCVDFYATCIQQYFKQLHFSYFIMC